MRDFRQCQEIGRRVSNILKKYSMVSPQAAASSIGLNKTTVAQAVREGRVPGAVKISERHWLIPRDALLAAIEAGTLRDTRPVTRPSRS